MVKTTRQYCNGKRREGAREGRAALVKREMTSEHVDGKSRQREAKESRVREYSRQAYSLENGRRFFARGGQARKSESLG